MMTPWCLTHRSPTQGRYLAPRWTTLQSHRTFRLSPFTRQIERGCASAAVVPVSRKWRISRRVRWTAPRSRIAPLPWGGISSFGPTYLQKKKMFQKSLPRYGLQRSCKFSSTEKFSFYYPLQACAPPLPQKDLSQIVADLARDFFILVEIPVDTKAPKGTSRFVSTLSGKFRRYMCLNSGHPPV